MQNSDENEKFTKDMQEKCKKQEIKIKELTDELKSSKNKY